jgi:hypothetical protein
LCFTTQAQHFPLLGHSFFGQTHSFTFSQLISQTSLTTFYRTAIAAWLFSGQPAENNSGGAPYISVNFDSGHRAVLGARPALHTTVFIFYLSLAILNTKNTVRASFRALSAADTFIK